MTHSTIPHAAPKPAGVTALQELTKNATQGYEKLLQLNIAATQAFFGQFQVVMDAKEAQSLRELQSELFAPLPNRYSAESQHYQLLAEDSSAKFNKIFQSKLTEAKNNLSILVDSVSSTAPTGTEVASAFLKNALTTSQGAIESAQHCASQVLQQAESSFTSVATQAFDAAGKAFNMDVSRERLSVASKHSEP
ncbi:phasin family protein [Rhodoferax sp.]|uniref:phasin family protein n=1 Tax=Rhodoferax sp. TaxID=50421 RepID=UPI00374D2C3C